MTVMKSQVIRPRTARQARTGRSRRRFTKELYPMGRQGGSREELAGRPPGLFGDLEVGLLLAPPDFPLVGGGPLLLGDVLEGLDDRLLDRVEAALDLFVVALLAVDLAVGAGLLVLEPLLDVLLELDEG